MHRVPLEYGVSAASILFVTYIYAGATREVEKEEEKEEAKREDERTKLI